MRNILCLFLSLGAVLSARAEPLVWGEPAPRSGPRSPPTVRPAAPASVRLLDGPFRHGQDLAVTYLKSLDSDRLLASFRKESGLEPKARAYGGWEARSIAGHSLGHYLSGCALAWAVTHDPWFREQVDFIVDELATCQEAAGDGYVSGIPGGRRAYEEVAAGQIRSSGFDLNGIWVPNYTMHKLFAGLRDAHRLAGSDRALDVARALADWFENIHRSLTEDQMQRVLAAEHGGLNEVFADLYADTGENRYLALSRRFHHQAILDPLAEGRDILPGKHANTQIPKVIGLATRYELAGDPADRLAAEFFWDRVVNHHSYVTGGHCDREHFGPPDQLNDRLSPATTETCNIYNMLKLSRHLFGWRPDAAIADYCERALLNHIRAAQHPMDGRVIYNLSLKPGHYKEYQDPYDAFTCCVGTGMETHLKYGDGIYFIGPDTVWVNLFISSRFQWTERSLVLTQTTDWPRGEQSTLTVQASAPTDLALCIRHPAWAQSLSIEVNDDPLPSVTTPSSYYRIRRTWRDGDRLRIRFPMTLRTESMPDNPDRLALFYGPTLLAADLGPIDDPEAMRPGFVPALVTAQRPVEAWLERTDPARLAFHTVGVGRPRDVFLAPFHELHNRRYTVYLDRYTPDQWQAIKVERAEEERRRQALEARTLDRFQPGEMQAERDHQVRGEKSDPVEALGRKLRHAYDGGWFSFAMQVDPVRTNQLVCTWWGSETGKRTFDVLVDDERIAMETLLENHPDRFWDQSYPIPFRLTQGKDRVTVRLQAHPGNYAGGLFESRMIHTEP